MWLQLFCYLFNFHFNFFYPLIFLFSIFGTHYYLFSLLFPYIMISYVVVWIVWIDIWIFGSIHLFVRFNREFMYQLISIAFIHNECECVFPHLVLLSLLAHVYNIYEIVSVRYTFTMSMMTVTWVRIGECEWCCCWLMSGVGFRYSYRSFFIFMRQPLRDTIWCESPCGRRIQNSFVVELYPWQCRNELNHLSDIGH